MTWRTPTTETEWNEAFSAHLDGELSAEDRAALERHLAANPARAAQLEDLRRLSATLRQWEIPVPPPDPDFCAAMASAAETRAGRPPRRAAARWSYALALYFLGLASGAGVMFLSRTGPPASPEQRLPAAAPLRQPQSIAVDSSLTHPAPPSTLSPAEADRLLSEVYASGLQDQVLAALRRGDAADARRLAISLQHRYPGSRASQSLSANPALQDVVANSAKPRGF